MNDSETHFLNVDLEIYSTSDLQPLVAAFGKDVSVLYVGRERRTHKAVLEITRMAKDADATIRVFCKLIDELPRGARKLWNQAKRRDFSIGIQSMEEPNSYDLALSADAVK